MRPDIKYLEEKFRYYNQLCFDGKLPTPVIKLNRRTRSLGLTRIQQNRFTRKKIVWIEISVYFDLPEKEYIDTLVHEMIHYYIAINNIKDNSVHGHVFKSEMERIRRSFNIDVSLKFNDSEALDSFSDPVVRYFCVSKDRTGNHYITVVAKTQIFKIWDMTESLNRNFECEWYVGFHKAFHRYPRSSTYKLYKIDSRTLQDILGSSKPLVRINNTIRPA